MALQLSGALEEEVLRARVSLILTDAARGETSCRHRSTQGVMALPDYAALVRGWCRPRRLADGRERSPVAFPCPWSGRGVQRMGGGARAVRRRGDAAGQRSASGFTAPTIWYLARLELQSGGVIGGTIPGIPACCWVGPRRWAGG